MHKHGKYYLPNLFTWFISLCVQMWVYRKITCQVLFSANISNRQLQLHGLPKERGGWEMERRERDVAGDSSLRGGGRRITCP